MSWWGDELPSARDAKRGVAPQAERLPNRKKHLDRDWYIVQFAAPYKGYERDANGEWVRKGRNDPPMMTKVSAHRTEGDARKDIDKNLYMRERPLHWSRDYKKQIDIGRYYRFFVVHKDLYEKYKALWK